MHDEYRDLWSGRFEPFVTGLPRDMEHRIYISIFSCDFDGLPVVLVVVHCLVELCVLEAEVELLLRVSCTEGVSDVLSSLLGGQLGDFIFGDCRAGCKCGKCCFQNQRLVHSFKS